MNQASFENLARRTFRGSSDALLQRAADEPDLAWRVLGTLNVFRVLLAAGLLVLFVVGGDTPAFGERYPTMFTAAAGGLQLPPCCRAFWLGEITKPPY